MPGKMGWGKRGGLLIVGVVAAIVLFLSLRVEAVLSEVPDKQQAATAVQAETQQAHQLPSLDVSDYDRLLQTYVTDEGWVDYAGLGRERGALNRFLEELGKAAPKDFGNDTQRLAFWINTYNAFTLPAALHTAYGKHQR